MVSTQPSNEVGHKRAMRASQGLRTIEQSYMYRSVMMLAQNGKEWLGVIAVCTNRASRRLDHEVYN